MRHASFLGHALAMSSIQERPSRSSLAGRIARVVGVLVLAFLVSSTIADRRGWVLGSLALLTYGLAGAAALRWPTSVGN